MAFTSAEWAALAANISAMIDVYRIGKETFETYFDRRLNSKSNADKAKALEQSFGTYSDSEIDAIEARIQSCRDRFITEGSGEARKNCLCSVLQDVMMGNGGTIPDSEWSNVYDALGCG